MKSIITELWTQEKKKTNKDKQKKTLENVSSYVMYLEDKYLFQINDILKSVAEN